MRRSFNACACPRNDFRAVFFLRKFFRNSVSFNVAKPCAYSGTSDGNPCAEGFRRRNCAAEKPDLAARQIRAKRVAFGLPQDSVVQLMFEACVNRNSRVSAFRDVGFHVERRITRPALRSHMRRKQLNRRPNLLGCTRDCLRMFLKRFHRHGFPQRTVRSRPRNVADCHQFAATCPVLAARLRWCARYRAMHLKRFNGSRFSSRSDFAIMILPQAAQRGLAKKAPLSERLS
jgi:hypothetical protein